MRAREGKRDGWRELWRCTVVGLGGEGGGGARICLLASI